MANRTTLIKTWVAPQRSLHFARPRIPDVDQAVISQRGNESPIVLGKCDRSDWTCVTLQLASDLQLICHCIPDLIQFMTRRSGDSAASQIQISMSSDPDRTWLPSW